MMLDTEFVKGCVAVPFAKPVPTRELTLLRIPCGPKAKPPQHSAKKPRQLFKLTLRRTASRTSRGEAASFFVYPKAHRVSKETHRVSE